MILTKENKQILQRNFSNFEVALDNLCNQMGLIKGEILEENGIRLCSVNYSNVKGLFFTTINGTVIDRDGKFECFLMVTQSVPYLETISEIYFGSWEKDSWHFSCN